MINPFFPNTDGLNNFYDKGRYLLAWRISFVILCIFIPLTIVYSFIDKDALVTTVSVLSVTLFSLVFLSRTKNFKPIFWLYSISGSVLGIFALCYVDNLTHYVDFIWLVCTILIAFIGLGKKAGIGIILLNCLGIFIFFAFFLNHHIETLEPRDDVTIISEYLELLASFFVISYLVHQFVSFQTKTQLALEDANAGLENQYNLISAKSKENETLIKEIHHRVKNNFQIIISLLRMQSMEMKTDEGKTHFREAINRIMAMSIVHQKLYTEKELSQIDLKSYIEDLTTEIITYSNKEFEIEIEIETNIQGMDLISVVPLGLLINELVSNSLKHAFTHGNQNRIAIQIKDLEKEYHFNYSDNGAWKENTKSGSNFGTELIDILTEQLNGSKTLDTSNGTNYHFTLSKIDV